MKEAYFSSGLDIDRTYSMCYGHGLSEFGIFLGLNNMYILQV